MGSPLAKKFNGKTYRLYGGWHVLRKKRTLYVEKGNMQESSIIQQGRPSMMFTSEASWPSGLR
jgi:hypothetical protein